MWCRAQFERYMFETTAGDELVLSVKGKGSTDLSVVNVVVGAVGMSPEDVSALRREANVSDAIWDRQSFALSHHWVKREARRLQVNRRSVLR